jgi:hypothetical protein
MRFFTKPYWLVSIALVVLPRLQAQTTLINPTLEGGFELGTSFGANGWTEAIYASGTNNNFYVGNPTGGANLPNPTGSNCAYVANIASSNTWSYLNTSSTVHFYRDVTFPAGETNITLTFKWKNNGEAGWDRPLVFLANTASPPALATGSPSSNSTTLSGYTLVSSTALTGSYANWTTATISISGAQAGNSSASSTRRLVFTWQNDGSGGAIPPAAIDDISLVSAQPTPYTWIGGSSGSWTTSTNWSPTRTTPTTTDVLQFDGGSSTVTAVPTQTIGTLRLLNNASINLQGAATTLTIGGASGTDLDVPAGSTLNINGSSSLTLTFSGSGNTASIAGTLGLSGSTGNTYTSNSSSTVITTVTGTINNASIITSVAAAMVFNSGSVYNHLAATTAGTIPISTWSTGSKVNITGYTSSSSFASNIAQTYYDFEWNCPNQTSVINFSTSQPTVSGTFTITSTGSTSLRLTGSSTATMTVGNFVQTGGTFDLCSGSSTGNLGTLKVNGSFTQSGGTLTESGSGSGLIEFAGSSSQMVMASGTISNTIGYRINNAAGANLSSALPVNTGASVTVTAGAFSGTLNYAGSNSLIYNGTMAQTTSDIEFPSTTNIVNLTINNAAGVALHADRSITGILTLTAGLFRLGANNFTLGSAATLSITTPSATKMISTNGTGALRRTMTTGAFTFPVGEETGTTEYSPFAISFSASNGSRTLGIRVVNATPPNNGSATNYLNRYWIVTDDAGGTYTYTATMTYLDADAFGGESTLAGQFYNGTAYQNISGTTVNTTTNVINIPATTQATTAFDNTGNTSLTGRVDPVACPTPFSLASSNVTGTTADINWTEAGAATTWDIYYSTANTAPTAGTTPTLDNVTNKPYNLTGLNPLTTYYVWVRADCGGSGTSSWSATSTTFTTPPDCAAAPTLACDATGSVNTSGSGAWFQSSANPCSFTSPGKETIYKFNATGSGTYTLQVLTASNTNYVDYLVKASSAGCDATGWTCIDDFNAVGTKTFTLAAGTEYYILADPETASTVNQTFKITNCPTACTNPSSVTSSNVTGTTAALNWTENGSATTWDIYYSTSSTAPTGATTPTLNDVATKPYTLTGLSPFTTYYAWVRADCGGIGTSNWVGSTSFTTTADCASAEALSCGQTQSVTLTGSGGWTGATGVFCGFSTPGQEKLFSFTPAISGIHTVSIGAYTGSSYIDFMYKNASGACSTAGWTCINDINTTDIGGSFSITLTAGTTYWILLDAESTASQSVTFTLTCPTACTNPSTLTSGNLTGTTAELNWTENGSATTWDIYYSTSSTAPTGATTPTVNDVATRPYTVTGLFPFTTYYAWVRADCGGIGTSNWVGSTSFMTTADCSSAEALSCGQSKSVTLTGSGGWAGGGVFCGFSTPGQEKMFAFTPTASGTYAVSIGAYTGSSYIDFLYKDASGTCSTAGWTCINDINTLDVGTSYSIMLSAGTTYWLLLDAESTAAQSVTFTLTCPANMAVVSATATQTATTSVNAGTANVQVLGLEIVTNGTLSPLTLTQLNLSTNGTTNATADLTNAKVYTTGTSGTFATTTLFGTAVVSPNGTFSVTGNLALTGGSVNTTNYLWLAYDLACGATGSDVIDGEFIDATIGGSAYTPTTPAPAGSRPVTPAFNPAYTSIGTTTVSTGSTNQQIVRINVAGSATCPGSVTNLTFNTSNTTAPATDIAKAKVYYTTTTTFAATTQFGSDINNPAAGDLAFTGSQTLAAGSGNYFWLVYDLPCDAAYNNVVNGTGVSMTVSGSSYTVTGTTPTAKTVTAPGSFTTVADGNWSQAATWGGCAPGNHAALATVTVNINHNVALDVDATTGSLTIAGGRTLNVGGNTLTLGTSSAGSATGNSNRSLAVNGTLAITGGTVNLNGGISVAASGGFTMSGGTLNIDPNDGTPTGSYSSSNGVFYIQSASLNVTGGTVNFLDPAYSTLGARSISYSHSSTDAVFGTGCTVTVGGGDDTNTAQTAGFYLECNTSIGTLELGTLVINGGRYIDRRHASSHTSDVYITKARNMTVGGGAEFVVNSAVLAITGDLVNNGYITVTSTAVDRGIAFVGDAQYIAGVTLSSSGAAQSLSGSGFFKKSTADADPALQADNKAASVSVFHDSGSGGLTLNMPLAAASTLRLASGVVNTTSGNVLTLGNGPASAAAGTLYTTSSTASPATGASWGTGGWVNGPFRRWVPVATTANQQGLLPVGTATLPQVGQISYTSIPSAGTITATFVSGVPAGGTTLPVSLTQTPGPSPIDLLSPSGSWNLVAGDGLSGGVYTAAFTANSFTNTGGQPIPSAEVTNLALVKRLSGSVLADDWTLNGVHVTASGTSASFTVSRSAMSGFSEFAVAGKLSALPVELKSFTGRPDGAANRLDWTTATEQNTAWFVIERSPDGVSNWLEVGRIAASGNTAAERSYMLPDAHPLSKSYYRLRTVDVDAREELSAIIVVVRAAGPRFAIEAVFPSPAVETLTVQYETVGEERVLVAVTDLAGRRVLEQATVTAPGPNRTVLPVAGLPAGVYLVVLHGDGRVSEPLKFVKQ